VTGAAAPGIVWPGKTCLPDSASSGVNFEPVFIKHSIGATL